MSFLQLSLAWCNSTLLRDFGLTAAIGSACLLPCSSLVPGPCWRLKVLVRIVSLVSTCVRDAIANIKKPQVVILVQRSIAHRVILPYITTDPSLQLHQLQFQHSPTSISTFRAKNFYIPSPKEISAIISTTLLQDHKVPHDEVSRPHKHPLPRNNNHGSSAPRHITRCRRSQRLHQRSMR